MKKLISMLIAVVMIASLFTVIAIPTSADEATSYASLYTGEMDISWYDKNDIKDEYHITTADQLAGLSYIVGYEFQRFVDVTFYLETDIVWNTGTFTIDDNGNPLYNNLAIDTTDENAHKAGDEVLKFWQPIGDNELNPSNGPSGDGQFYGRL